MPIALDRIAKPIRLSMVMPGLAVPLLVDAGGKRHLQVARRGGLRRIGHRPRLDARVVQLLEVAQLVISGMVAGTTNVWLPSMGRSGQQLSRWPSS